MRRAGDRAVTRVGRAGNEAPAGPNRVSCPPLPADPPAQEAATMLRTFLPFALAATVAGLQGRGTLPPDFVAFLAAMDAAQVELQNGRPAAYAALWSRADDVTLAGGLGGVVERGWPGVERRLAWAGTQFSKGTNRIERLSAGVGGDLAYVVQAEHLRYVVPGESRETTRDYRVTMVFRREAGHWRIVHRHADSQTAKAPG